MNKKEELDKLDGLVRKKMLDILSGYSQDNLAELNTVVQYLAKNNVTEEKAKGTVEEDIAKRLQDAKDRRGGKKVEDEDEF